MAGLRVLGAALAAGLAMGGTAHAASPTVRTQSGVVRGVDQGGVTRWLAIPYAAPPVGKLRWRAPQPPASWRGVRAADRFAPGCMQNVTPKTPGGAFPVSEDCLYLNVWAPDGAAARKRPVMVWIHGGGFNLGATRWPQTDGTLLARRGVIVVSVGYRLGKFGFFAHPALAREAHGGPIGNYGIMDMIAALKWVKANISGFGGDPGNVTVFGESAGGEAVHMLMISPMARGLFQKAIVESGGPGRMKGLQAAEADGRAAARGWGVTSDDAAALRAVPAATVLGHATIGRGGGSPMIDGEVVPEDILTAYKAGRIAHVPIIIGTNSYEGGAFPGWASQVRKTYAAQWPKITQVYDGYGTHDPDKIGGELGTDVHMTFPAREAAAAAAKVGVPAYVYSFNYLRPSQRGKLPGAIHFDEVYAVFGTEPTSPGKDPNDLAIVDAVQSRWTNFAKTGVPSPDWPRFNASSQAVEVFTNQGPRPERDYLKARMALDATLPAPPGP